MEPLKAVIAEDEQLTRTIIRARLEKLGHVVVAEAGDGSQAIEAARLHKPDVIIMDIKMPVMDGLALALATARDYPALPILLMTGFADQRERASGLEALVSDVISKPFSVAEIKFAVAAALAKGKR
jgi:CheY-like chemotaxis protein